MTPQQALQILSQAAAQAQMTLKMHQVVQQAVQVLNDLTTETSNLKTTGDMDAVK